MNEELFSKRISVLDGVWSHLIEREYFSVGSFELNKSLASEVVIHYLKDVEILKARYGICGYIQTPKVAGLMAASIMRFRPVVPKTGVELSESELFANETLAIYHGLCVCAEFSGPEALKTFMSADFFEEWFDNFKFMLHFRNFSPENLIIVFDTVSRFVFPQAFSGSD